MNKYLPVSVIIPYYNSSKTIYRALFSIEKQYFKPKEVIVVDDGSSDVNTKKILENIEVNFSKCFSLKIYRLSNNRGAASARNEGWRHVTQPYIAFLDSDDVWHPCKLKIQYDAMHGYCEHEIEFSSHDISIIKNQNEFKENNVNFKNIKIDILNKNNLLFKRKFPTSSSVMIKANIKERFLEGKRYSEDYLLWMRILSEGKGVYIKEKLSGSFKGFFGEGGLTKELWMVEKGEIETFWILGKDNKYNKFLIFAALIFSILKHIRRMWISFYVLRKGNNENYS